MHPTTKRRRDPTKAPRVAILIIAISWPIFSYALAEYYYAREYSTARLIDKKSDTWSIVYKDGTRGPIDGHDLKNNAGIAWFVGPIHATVACGVAAAVCGAWWFSTLPRR